MATLVEITNTENPKVGQKFPFIRMDNRWSITDQKYVYEDSGEVQIQTQDAKIVTA